jgi:hypothetical protein
LIGATNDPGIKGSRRNKKYYIEEFNPTYNHHKIKGNLGRKGVYVLHLGKSGNKKTSHFRM